MGYSQVFEGIRRYGRVVVVVVALVYFGVWLEIFKPVCADYGFCIALVTVGFNFWGWELFAVCLLSPKTETDVECWNHI